MNYALRTIDRIGSAREIDLGSRRLDYRDQRCSVPGFTDVTDRPNSGIYLLCRAGRVVRICKVRKNFLETVSGLRSRPRTLSVEFDQVLIRACHPDEIDGVYQDLINTYGVT